MGIASYNLRNAFSHSIQCDEFFSKICDLPGGEEHIRCACWCHGNNELLNTSEDEPVYDLTPPPEYANSADVFISNEVPDVESNDERCETCGDLLTICECVE